jgi:L-rhamnose mutarotase
MKRIAQTVDLKDHPDLIRRYEEHHAHPWPEVVAGTWATGIQRVFIYRYGTRLFMFLEVPDDFDLARDGPKYLEHPRAQEWDALMRTFQQTVPGAPPGSTWVEMKEVYALEAPPSPATQPGAWAHKSHTVPIASEPAGR